MGLTFFHSKWSKNQNILLHGNHLRLLPVRSAYYVKALIVPKIQCRPRIELEKYAANSNNRFVVQTVAYIIHQVHPVYSFFHHFLHALSHMHDSSLCHLFCITGDTLDADSICSCDSSLAIGSRPPFWCKIVSAKGWTLNLGKPIGWKPIDSELLANSLSLFPFVVYIIPHRNDNVNSFKCIFLIILYCLNKTRRNI